MSSPNPVIASISRQVLNLEINYANFCGVTRLVVMGPARDASKDGGNQGLAQYSRAIQEALTVGSRMMLIVHVPMYREPATEDQRPTLASLDKDGTTGQKKKFDLWSSWDSWDHIRSVCNYDMRLCVGKYCAILCSWT